MTGYYTTASRQVLWNVDTPTNVILMYALFALSLVVCLYGFYRRFSLWSAGKNDSSRFGRLWKRFEIIGDNVLLQKKTVRHPKALVFHTLIFWGFLALLFTTTMVFIDEDLGIPIYRGQFYLGVTVISDLFGLGLLIGVATAAYHRLIERPDRLHTTRSDILVLGLLALMVVQGFVLEGLRIHVTDDPWKHFSPVGYLFSLGFWSLSADGASALHFVMWWFHTATVFAFIATLPYTKLLHILASSANLFFQDIERPKGALRHPGDIEKLLESAGAADGEFAIGVSTVADLTWKQRLDLDACTSCGRCQEACPAYNSGKVLSPKWLILDSRNHLLSLYASGEIAGALPGIRALDHVDGHLLGNLLLKNEPTDGSRSHRAANPLVQAAPHRVGFSPEEKLAGGVMDEDVFWACTTCRACVQVCPVGIEHVDMILDVRRSLALMEGSIPGEAQASLRAIESRGNPFGPPDGREEWHSGLNVRILEDGDEVDVLYWVGCISAYDRRKQRIARALATILNAAGVSWGILGNRECCSGDPARRLGEENLFQTLAKGNIETLRSVRFRRVVANCPHCFNTLGNEYPQVGDAFDGRDVRVMHHTELIHQLLAEKKISVDEAATESLTYHDPCYLGRYNDRYDEPREVLVQLGKRPINEMPRSRENGFCCGAGGGHFWMDMKAGERVNVLRIREAAATGASTVATGCPFCLHMLEDGAKLTDQEDTLAVRDVAEIVAAKLIVPSRDGAGSAAERPTAEA